MPQGIQVWDASGNLILDTSTVTVRILDVITISANGSGNITNTQFSTGVPFYFFQPFQYLIGNYQPTVTFSGNTMSWSLPNFAPSGLLYYGVRS
jgi:hypothetical protein